MKLLTEVIRAAQPWLFDPAVIPGVMESPIPSLGRRPVVGILHQSGVTPHPPVRRALREAQLKVEAAGYEVRDFTPICPDFREIREISSQLFTVDGSSYPRRELAKAGEPVVPSVIKFGFFDMPRKTHEEMWQWNTKKGAMQKKMLDAWQQLGIDVLIAPAAPHTPITPDNCTSELYTVAWNAVDVRNEPFILLVNKSDTDYDASIPRLSSRSLKRILHSTQRMPNSSRSMTWTRAFRICVSNLTSVVNAWSLC